MLLDSQVAPQVQAANLGIAVNQAEEANGALIPVDGKAIDAVAPTIKHGGEGPVIVR